MASSFDEYIKKVQDQAKETKKSFEWYLSKLRELVTKKEQKAQEKTDSLTSEKKSDDESQDKKEDSRKETEQSNNTLYTTSSPDQSMIGKLLFYSYDPKLKETLPYYDRFPLAFWFNMTNTGPLGLNMHYLPPVLRARFLENLMRLANSTELNYNTKLNLTYKLIKGVSGIPYYKPCIKRYLTSHMRSRISVINPKEWQKVIFLPSQGFMKASDDKVWQDSVDMITKSSMKRNK